MSMTCTVQDATLTIAAFFCLQSNAQVPVDEAKRLLRQRPELLEMLTHATTTQ